MRIEGVQGVREDIGEMLSKMRDLSSKSKVFSEINAASEVATPTQNFGDVLSIAKNAVTNVNNIQVESEQLKNAYISGDSNVSISQVVLASQKSKLAFEGLLAVRNKVLEAYKEIMNMPV